MATEPPLKTGQVIEIQVSRLGGQGDGVASSASGKPVYVPLALPGERVRVRLERTLGDGFAASLSEILTPAAERIDPACPHYARCGGCTLQHVQPQAYAAHKRQVVVQALAQHRLEGIDVKETQVMPAASRRRLTLAALHTKGGAILGFNERASHQVVDIGACPIARPELVALLPKLRAALGPWLQKAKALDLTLTATSGGIDLLITGPEPDLIGREAVALLGSLPTLARISWRKSERAASEPLLMQRQPVMTFGGIAVAFPPGAFLQASAEGEATLRKLVEEALPTPCRRVADLFCGLGTFGLPLASRMDVWALESDPASIAALATAAKGQPRLKVSARDLFREPLTADEMDGLDAVIFDPPRAGAQAQCRELAQSDVPVIIAVSCNPGTFARDAQTLINGGYTCEWVQPVDQFVWSSHVELVARFSRG